MEESLLQKHYLLVMILTMAAVSIVGAITMQLLAAGLVILFIVGVTLVIGGLRKERSPVTGCARSLETMDEGSVVIAAALLAFAGMALTVWVVWAVALAVLFLIQQSLSRIEHRLDALEKK
jgi:hypothetical protein